MAVPMIAQLALVSQSGRESRKGRDIFGVRLVHLCHIIHHS